MPGQIMLDPSLFFSERSFGQVREAYSEGELDGAFIPRAFQQALRIPFRIAELAPFGAWGRLSDFTELFEFFERANRLEGYEGWLASSPDFAVEQLLRLGTQSELEAETLVQEWRFLVSESWIASRTKRTFKQFVKAGAATIELSRHHFESVAAGSLKVPGERLPSQLSRKQRLRAVAKWVAVGGPGVLSLTDPVLSALGSTAAGFFLLFDP